MQRLNTLGALALAVLTSSVNAATFCVASPAQLISALTTASANGEADIIKVHQGNYLLTEPPIYNASENFDLNISGGWLSIPTACAVQFADASVTVLDGQGTTGGLYLHASGSSPGAYSVSNLTVTRTRPAPPTYSAGIFGNVSQATNPASFDFFNLIVRDSFDTLANDIGLGTTGRADVRIRNTLITGNQSPGFVGVYTHSTSFGSTSLQHVTIANNQSSGNTYAGVDARGDTVLTVENSIIWGNTSANPQGNCPLNVTNADRLRFVIATSVCGQQAGANIGVNSFNPRFVDAGFHIGADSPAFDVGMNPPTLPLIAKDLDNNNRVMGPKPDLGAFESTALFRGGFE